MAVPFSFSEFEIQAATLKHRGYSLSSNMGYSETPVTASGFTGSFHNLSSGDRESYAGTPMAVARYKLITSNMTLTVVNGDIVVIGSDSYEVVDYSTVVSFIGSYAMFLLKRFKE